MAAIAHRLLGNLHVAGEAEISETLVTGRGVRLLRIVSKGQASPDGFWYDQQDAEWVMVVSGSARLAIMGEAADRVLGPGDAIYLPAHCRHRVTWTDPDRPTVWVALFLDQIIDPAPSASEP